MSLNLYYGVKDPEYNFSFKETEWLTPYQVLSKLNIKNLTSYQLSPSNLIYPNELILSEHNSILTDLILLAKYTDNYGSLNLKSLFLSELILNLTLSSNNFSKLRILSIEKDSYYWSKVTNAHYIPKHAYRVGYDNLAKQFSYIGRMKLSNLLLHQQNQNNSFNLRNMTSKITNLFGSLINIYEYIPAIVLQLDNQSDSFWSKIKLSIKSSNTSNLDLNLVTNNYEVLCLKKQPATLKQLCIIRLVKLEEDSFNLLLSSSSNINTEVLNLNRSLRLLPSSIRNLLWPSFLVPGQCISKNGKMRSVNGIYELSINKMGSLRFLFMNKMFDLESVTYEKNVESLLISKTGVYLIYDYKQATRRPTLLYKHQYVINSNLLVIDDDRNFENLFDNSLSTSFILELSNEGFLRIIIQKSRPNVINLINLNDFFRPMISSNSEKLNNLDHDIKKQLSSNISAQTNKKSLLINVRFVADFKDFIRFPVKIIDLVVNFIKSIVQNILIRIPNRQLN